MTQAQRAFALGDSKMALELVRKVYRIRRVEAPSANVSPMVNLMFATYANGVGDRDSTFRACSVVLSQLNNAKPDWSRHYSIHDVQYMKYYCKAMLVSLVQDCDGPELRLARTISIPYSIIRLGSVKGIIRSSFPMNGKFGKEVDEFISNNSPGGVHVAPEGGDGLDSTR